MKSESEIHYDHKYANFNSVSQWKTVFTNKFLCFPRQVESLQSSTCNIFMDIANTLTLKDWHKYREINREK